MDVTLVFRFTRPLLPLPRMILPGSDICIQLYAILPTECSALLQFRPVHQVRGFAQPPDVGAVVESVGCGSHPRFPAGVCINLMKYDMVFAADECRRQGTTSNFCRRHRTYRNAYYRHSLGCVTGRGCSSYLSARCLVCCI